MLYFKVSFSAIKVHMSLDAQTESQDSKEILLSLVPFFGKTRLPQLNKFLLSFFSITSVVTQNTFKVCLGTFNFNFLLFFIRSNKKEKETLPNFWLLEEPKLPGSFPHRCVLIQACYKLVVSIWIPDNKDQSESITILWYCKSLLIKIKCLFE